MEAALADGAVNIAWVQESGEILEYGTAIAAELRHHGINVIFFTKLRSTHERLLTLGFNSVFMAPIAYNQPALSAAEIEEIEARYGAPGLASVARSCMQFDWIGLSAEEKMAVVARHYLFWERAIDEHRIVFGIGKVNGPVEPRTMWRVAGRRGIPYMQIGPGAIEGTFTLNDVGEALVWRELLDRLAEGPRPLTEAERAVVAAHLPQGPAGSPPRLKPNLRWVGSLLRAITKPRARWPYADSDRVEDPINYAAGRRVRELFWQQLRWQLVTSKLFDYDQPDPADKFVLFPFHHREEGVTLATTPVFCHHIEMLVEELAVNLPHGYTLYVKEHPVHLGQWPMAALKRLKRLPRVKVIDPATPMAPLLERCAALTTVDGTAGWEALVRRKPVLSFGTRDYSYCDLVYKIGSPNELAEVLTRMLRAGPDIYRERETEWWWFIWCAISTSIPGDLCPTQYPYVPELSAANVGKVAAGIAAKLTATTGIRPAAPVPAAGTA